MLKDVRLVEAVAVYLAAVVFTTLSLITTGQYKSALKCAVISCAILLLLLITVEIGRRISPTAIPTAPQMPQRSEDRKKQQVNPKHSKKVTHRHRVRRCHC
jgi:hypothetical protein